jgi:hypothetical protein
MYRTYVVKTESQAVEFHYGMSVFFPTVLVMYRKENLNINCPVLHFLEHSQLLISEVRITVNLSWVEKCD